MDKLPLYEEPFNTDSFVVNVPCEVQTKFVMRPAPPISLTSQEPPPPSSLLDRLARWLEGGGSGTPATIVADLAGVLSAQELSDLPSEVVDFFADPGSFVVVAGLDAGPFSRALLALSAVLARQTDIPDRVRGFEGYPVTQRIYRDRHGRTHWDRYGLVDGAWRRLFLARVAASPGHFTETFLIYGVPVALPFRARVEDGALVFTLTPSLRAPFSWIGKVEYRTRRTGPGAVETKGDFRVPLVGFRVAMEFRSRR
ncbi:MAG: hypothetical protein JWP97_6043 [Labilithrix sp.]|nr:hypothetical protein [Labilithrix sp.]